VGFEDGLFPGVRAIGDRDEMEEERRLCYVAITRAKQTLTVSYARQRMLYGRTTPGIRSRFLKEIPADCVIHKGGFQPKPERTGTDFQSAAPTYQKPRYNATVTPVKSTPIPELNKGDMVSHAAFGRGMVLSVMKMGGDALLEIAFDDIGTKKLMAKAASVHMKKL
jgi:DNA helicase-2/ATP-dependent DNA helicase PcrA